MENINKEILIKRITELAKDKGISAHHRHQNRKPFVLNGFLVFVSTIGVFSFINITFKCHIIHFQIAFSTPNAP